MTLTSRFLLALGNPEATRPERAGGKAATLARLSQAGFDVPQGIVLDVSAFHLAVDRMQEASAEAIRQVQIPPAVEQAVIQAAAILGDHDVVVRSSAPDEDSAHASFAGQYESVLGVHGPEEIVSAVRECWASTFGPRVHSYRDDGAKDRGMAVLIQRQVAADAAGVAFSVDPVTGDRDVVVIDTVAGLGDRLMSGEITPERWRIVGESPAQHSLDPSVLTEIEARRIAHLVRRLEAFLDLPQDVEWAIEAGKLWLLQSRPITALPEESVGPIPVPVDIPDGYWERDASHWPAPNSPLSRSIIYPLANEVTPRMCAEYGMLAERIELTDIGGWHYTRTVPLGGKDRRPPPALVLGVMARLHPVLRLRIKTATEAVR
ncbi:MAG: PEP/pyruvate-binding domain-containing protein, partial [Acidimicrobiia bacterium]